jgi:23S rRNA (adenine2503-C2)-methyltransferase
MTLSLPARPTVPDHRGHLKSHAPEALRTRFRAAGLEAYRADQVLAWLYRRGVEDPEAMTDLSHALRRELAQRWQTRALAVERVQRAADGTRKLALRAADGAVVEAVLIPEERRNTLCVSTQVGCPLACNFCATGAMGFTRNLTTAEIVDQVCRARSLLGEEEQLTNVVFMGMGEPLLNLPAVLEAIRILVHPKGFAMAPRRVTVSTVGVVPRLHALLDVAPINLAVSLHATTDEVRDRLVPLNRRYPLAELLDALRREPLVDRRRPVFFEYTLMEGVNDSLDDARRLPRLLRGIPSKLNVIPMNEHPAAPYRAPARELVDRFTAELHRAGLRVTLRRNRGADIEAACGQLAAGRGGGAPGARIQEPRHQRSS